MAKEGTLSNSFYEATISSVVTQSCPTLCHPVDCSMPGFPVHHQLLELAQTHVRNSVISSSVIPFSSCLQSFSATGYFPMSQFFASGGQSIGVSASVSVLPMNIQDLSPLGWTDWISLQSKGLSSIFPNIIVGGHHHPDIKTRLIPQKRKLQANITDEHRCNCPQQNSSNPNSTIH